MTPYHYTRVESFDDHDVLVVGGSDHPTGQHPSEYYNAYAQLEHYARERWTQAGETLYRWTGQVGLLSLLCYAFRLLYICYALSSFVEVCDGL